MSWCKSEQQSLASLEAWNYEEDLGKEVQGTVNGADLHIPQPLSLVPTKLAKAVHLACPKCRTSVLPLAASKDGASLLLNKGAPRLRMYSSVNVDAGRFARAVRVQCKRCSKFFPARLYENRGVLRTSAHCDKCRSHVLVAQDPERWNWED